MGAVNEYNRKDMHFHEISNVLAHYMDDTGELPEFPWQVNAFLTNENLAFLAGLYWFSTHQQRLRYTGSNHTNADMEATVTFNVSRVHNHTQGALTDIWTVTHNFGTHKPAVFVYDEDDNAIDAAIEHTDENTTVITFAEDMVGYAVLLG